MELPGHGQVNGLAEEDRMVRRLGLAQEDEPGT